ncbi:MAG: TRAP transporter large permease [Synergistaceae bacterium]|jgi:tripartite ATP-independent transporter DctM subunit|nr:TRAP transporter large permease [Synergistaceae bacterium]
MSAGLIVALVTFLGGLICSVPLGWLFLGAPLFGSLADGVSFAFIPMTLYHAMNNSTILGIAVFVYAGSLISDAGLADRIVRFSYALVGRVRGGMALVGVVAAVFMGALTGSSVPVISALIPLLVPRLKKYGYAPRYTTAVLCSSSFLGYLIPPSVPALIYCLLTQQSIAALFLSTVFPGLLLALGYGILNYFICPNYVMPELISAEVAAEMSRNQEIEAGGGRLKELLSATWSALPALGCPALILTSIYGGLCTPNEAGALAVGYSLFVGFFVYRELTIKKWWKATYHTVISLGVIAILVLGGTVFARYLTKQGVAQQMTSFMLGLFHGKYMILLAVNLLFLFMGMFMEAIPIMLLGVPLVMPLMQELGVNMVHLGAMIIVNVGLGVVTPPFAMSIFIGSRLSGCGYGELVPIMMKFLLFVGIPVLLLTAYLPVLSCWLPEVMLGSMVVGPW